MNLFDYLKSVTDLPHGWCSLEKSKMLAGIVLATRPALVCEIGVWSGRSLIASALACKEVNYGKCIGIDPYKADASVEGQTGKNAEWWSDQDNHNAMFVYCQQQINAFGVGHTATLIHARSDDVDPQQLGTINVLHLDGNHGPQALKDIQRFAPFIPVGGFAVLDDLHWEHGAVSKSVDYLLNNGFIEHFRVQNEGNDFGVFQRVKGPKK